MPSLGESYEIFGSAASDVFRMDPTLFDDIYSHTAYIKFKTVAPNTLPEFVTPMEKLTIIAESAFSYELPEIYDAERIDQPIIVVTIKSPDGITWLKISEDYKTIFAEAGPSTANQQGTYFFEVILNDGYEFGINEAFFPLEV